jgi:phosphoglycerate kinase
VKILLPSDVVVADKFAADANTQIVSVDAIPEEGRCRLKPAETRVESANVL